MVSGLLLEEKKKKKPVGWVVVGLRGSVQKSLLGSLCEYRIYRTGDEEKTEGVMILRNIFL